MKHLLFILTAITTLMVSCRTYQKKSRAENSHYASVDLVDQFRYGYQQQEVDTFERIWYFQADSSFHYHADDGITAGSGLLWLIEKGRSRMDFQQFSAQQKKQTMIEEKKEQQDEKRVFKMPSVWWIFMLLTGGFLFLWVRNKR